MGNFCENELIGGVLFEDGNTEHFLSRSMIEKVYRFKNNEYLREDARYHLNEFIFGTNPESLSDNDFIKCVANFQRKYLISTLSAYDSLDDIVEKFKNEQDCNIPENNTWDNVITEYFYNMIQHD